ncbi:MAG TPA: tetratricopeptide repeat protein, partial [Acidimicrobiales bacterium]|nr:tetratricopeptide repeat protein [Acidimicrobiales bacterium]
AEAMWGGEDPPATWPASLRGVIFRLRGSLDAVGLDGSEVLRSSLGCYQLHLPVQATVDVEEAGRLLHAARTALDSGDALAARQAAAESAAMSHADFLPGASGAWVETRQAQFRELHLQALDVLAEASTATGHWEDAVAAAEEAVEREPFRESSHLLLMKAHDAAGNRAAAVRAFERCRASLRAELDIEPSVTTTAAYRRIAAATDGDGRPPAGRPTATNLPTALSTFVGRDGELPRLEAAARRSRLVTLIGPAGVGKSRLAVELARRLAPAHPDGVWLVELADVRDPGGVAQQVLFVLRLPEAPGCGSTESLVAALAHRQALLVLDNCEHLVAACAALAATLLGACPGLRIVVTSREPLRLPGEATWVVSSLAVPESAGTGDLESLLEYDGVRLFVERAAMFAPGLDLQPTAAVVDICRLLDGLPLALELAAAHTRLVPLEEMARRLDAHGPVLTRGMRHGPARHQTFQAALDWSYDLLSAREQRVLCALSVFAGGFTLDAAEAVGDGGVEVIESLTALVDKSLVVLERRAGMMRYRLLETIRDYGQQRLTAAGTVAPAKDAHLRWAVGLAGTAEPELGGSLQDKWLAVLDAEHDNLRAALEWASSQGRAAEQVALTLSLSRFWEVRGYLTEGRSWLEAAARASDAGADALARCLNASGVLAHHQCDYPTALRLHQDAAAAFEQLGNQRGAATALNGLANVASSTGDLATASQMYSRVIEIGRDLADQRILAASLMNLGVAILHQVWDGRLPAHEAVRAHQVFGEALYLHRELGDLHGISLSLQNLGVLSGFQGDDDIASRYLEESLAISRQLGDSKGVAATVRFLGQLAVRGGDYDAAQRHLEECLEIVRRLGSHRLVAEALGFLGDIADRQSDPVRSRRLLEESLLLFEQVGDEAEVSRVLSQLERVRLRR